MFGVGSFALLVAASSVREPPARLQLEPVAAFVATGLASSQSRPIEMTRTTAPAGQVAEPEGGDGLGALLARLAPIASLAPLIDLVTLVREGQPVVRGEPILLRLVFPARIYVGWSF